MGCDFPLKAYRAAALEDGKRGITFNPLRAADPQTGAFDVPCGQCTGCRLERARQWSVRMMHEAKLWPANSFVTLTFSDEHLPVDYSVQVRDVQLFMKRLRKSFPQRIRFFGCGEYGDLNLRPHYHLILFNLDFPDKQLFKQTKHSTLYTSKLLSELWPYGHASCGAVTHQSAGYVARYTLKKIGGERAADHYTRIHPVTNTVHTVQPEFCVMSRKPGIGFAWLERFKSDVFPSGYLIVDGRKVPPPRFYIERLSEEEKEYLKRQSRRAALPYKPHKTTERRRAKAAVRDARIRPLQRNL